MRLVQGEDNDLPTLSVVIKKIICVASDQNATTQDLAGVIAYDQGMTNKLLKLSNSAYYSQKTKVETVKRAISVIGFDEIIGIALGMEIFSGLFKTSGSNLDLKKMWFHGIGVAIASKEIARLVTPGLANQVFIPAILHDMGKVFFLVYFRSEYRKVWQFAKKGKKKLYWSENAVFGIDHAKLSGLLMKRWYFPQSIILPCAFHHSPEVAPTKFRQQAFIINFADYLTQRSGIGHSWNPMPPTLKSLPKEIGIRQSICKLVIDKLRQKEDGIKEMFDLTL